ncbi:MAG: hypothetical protein ACSLFQ_14480 [Thermoanaerobaculia bacterium]
MLVRDRELRERRSADHPAVVRPDGTLPSHQPYGLHGLLVADIDTDLATGLLASRFRMG